MHIEIHRPTHKQRCYRQEVLREKCLSHGTVQILRTDPTAHGKTRDPEREQERQRNRDGGEVKGWHYGDIKVEKQKTLSE